MKLIFERTGLSYALLECAVINTLDNDLHGNTNSMPDQLAALYTAGLTDGEIWNKALANYLKPDMTVYIEQTGNNLKFLKGIVKEVSKEFATVEISNSCTYEIPYDKLSLKDKRDNFFESLNNSRTSLCI